MLRHSCPMMSLVFFLCRILCPPVSSDAKSNQDFFTVYELQVEGDYIDHLIEDLNGDGLNDGLFFHSARQGQTASRWFSVFYQHPEGFNKQADYQLGVALLHFPNF